MPDDPTTRLNAALASRYRTERPLGESGMATVYLAEDLKHDRRVANDARIVINWIEEVRERVGRWEARVSGPASRPRVPGSATGA